MKVIHVRLAVAVPDGTDPRAFLEERLNTNDAEFNVVDWLECGKTTSVTSSHVPEPEQVSDCTQDAWSKWEEAAKEVLKAEIGFDEVIEGRLHYIVDIVLAMYKYGFSSTDAAIKLMVATDDVGYRLTEATYRAQIQSTSLRDFLLIWL